MVSIVSDSVQKAFSSASFYENVRPGYPVDGVKFFLKNLGAMGNENNSIRHRPFTILEVGSGTGKFTRSMLEVLKGSNTRVIASEPVQSMIEQFKEVVTDTEIIQCSAEKITLPDASVDAVIAPQCFHWFTNRASLKEIHRVLAPGGTFGIIWSIEDMSVPWLKDVYEFLEPRFEEISQINPYRKEWKPMFNQLANQLFSAPEENLTFKYSFTSCFDEAYKYFSSFSVLTGGSERNQIAFKEHFDNVVEKHFKSKGIPFDHIALKLYMYCCTKET